MTANKKSLSPHASVGVSQRQEPPGCPFSGQRGSDRPSSTNPQPGRRTWRRGKSWRSHYDTHAERFISGRSSVGRAPPGLADGAHRGFHPFSRGCGLKGAPDGPVGAAGRDSTPPHGGVRIESFGRECVPGGGSGSTPLVRSPRQPLGPLSTHQPTTNP